MTDYGEYSRDKFQYSQYELMCTIKAIPKFSARDPTYTITHWAKELENVAEIFHLTRRQLLLIAKQTLTSTAALWLRSEVYGFESYEELKTAISEEFPDFVDLTQDSATSTDSCQGDVYVAADVTTDEKLRMRGSCVDLSNVERQSNAEISSCDKMATNVKNDSDDFIVTVNKKADEKLRPTIEEFVPQLSCNNIEEEIPVVRRQQREVTPASEKNDEQRERKREPLLKIKEYIRIHELLLVEGTDTIIDDGRKLHQKAKDR